MIRMKFKWIYLFVGLLFPILIFLFLRFFGKNEFNIPVYYENGIDSLKTECPFVYSKPYALPDSIFSRFNEEKKPMLITLDSSVAARKNFARIDEEIGRSQYAFTTLHGEDLNNPIIPCVLLLNKPWTTVLVDGQRRIRGYYSPNTLEEADRLIVEMKILLKQY
jgi:hypothetical protein